MEEILVLGLIVWLVIFLIRRRRRRDMSLKPPAAPPVQRHVVRHVHEDRRAGAVPAVRPGWKPHWEGQKQKPPDLEQKVLKTAKAHEGIVTPTDIAIGTGCELKTAQQFLESLVKQGHAELRATRAGDLVYVFPSLLGKNRPQDLESLT